MIKVAALLLVVGSIAQAQGAPPPPPGPNSAASTRLSKDLPQPGAGEVQVKITSITPPPIPGPPAPSAPSKSTTPPAPAPAPTPPTPPTGSMSGSEASGRITTWSMRMPFTVSGPQGQSMVFGPALVGWFCNVHVSTAPFADKLTCAQK